MMIREQRCADHRRGHAPFEAFAIGKSAEAVLPSIPITPPLWLALSALADHEGRDIFEIAAMLIGDGARARYSGGRKEQ